MEAIIVHFSHISILWYFLTVVPVVKNNQIDKNTLRFTCYTFPRCASSNGLHGRIHNHTDYISTLSVFKCVLKMPAQLDKKLHQLQFFWFSPLWLFNGFPMTLLPEHKKSTRMPGATRCCFALRLPFLWLEVPIQGQFEGSPVSLVQGKMIFLFFLMFSTDEIYDTVLILCCCSTSVFRGDIKLYHWVSKGQCFSK